MKTSILILTKLFSLILVGALLVLLLNFLDDILFSNYPGDASMVAASLLATIPLSNYLLTVYVCNKIIKEDIQKPSRIINVAFLLLAIISFVFSICVLIIVANALIEVVENKTAAGWYDRGGKDIILLLSLSAFALLGPLTFFFQLSVRKIFITKSATTADKLVDSIGT